MHEVQCMVFCRLYSKEKPLSVTKGLGIEKFDCEGRIITAEYENFYFLTSCESLNDIVMCYDVFTQCHPSIGSVL